MFRSCSQCQACVAVSENLDFCCKYRSKGVVIHSLEHEHAMTFHLVLLLRDGFEHLNVQSHFQRNPVYFWLIALFPPARCLSQEIEFGNLKNISF